MQLCWSRFCCERNKTIFVKIYDTIYIFLEFDRTIKRNVCITTFFSILCVNELQNKVAKYTWNIIFPVRVNLCKKPIVYCIPQWDLDIPNVSYIFNFLFGDFHMLTYLSLILLQSNLLNYQYFISKENYKTMHAFHLIKVKYLVRGDWKVQKMWYNVSRCVSFQECLLC